MPKMISWSERVRYDVQVDRQVSRVSGFDDHHQEHWIKVETGKGYRDRRTEAVLKIQESIEAGDPPGEVGATQQVASEEE
jgi:hypothetical protein